MRPDCCADRSRLGHLGGDEIRLAAVEHRTMAADGRTNRIEQQPGRCRHTAADDHAFHIHYFHDIGNRGAESLSGARENLYAFRVAEHRGGGNGLRIDGAVIAAQNLAQPRSAALQQWPEAAAAMAVPDA